MCNTSRTPALDAIRRDVRRRSRSYDAALNASEQRRHDELEKRYEGGGKELSDREMDEFRELHRRHVDG